MLCNDFSNFYVMGYDKDSGEPIKANCVESVLSFEISLMFRFCTLQKREPEDCNCNTLLLYYSFVFLITKMSLLKGNKHLDCSSTKDRSWFNLTC